VVEADFVARGRAAVGVRVVEEDVPGAAVVVVRVEAEDGPAAAAVVATTIKATLASRANRAGKLRISGFVGVANQRF
jgi:hypothetical protein